MPDSSSPDFYDLGSLLPDDERQVRDAVGRLVDDRVLPIIADCFERERFPAELVSEMAAPMPGNGRRCVRMQHTVPTA